MSTPVPRRTRLMGGALLVAAFVAGALAGTAFERVARAEEPPPAAAERAPGERKDGRSGRTSEILKELDLTPEQQRRVDAIMERRHAQMEAFWQGEGRKLRAIVDSARGEVRAVLDPAQQVRYDSLRAARKRRHEAKDGAPPPPPPPGS